MSSEEYKMSSEHFPGLEGWDLTVGSPLAGGVVSDVFEAEIRQDGHTLPAVLKHTLPSKDPGITFSHTDHDLLANSFATHSLDLSVLTALQGNADIRVPTVYDGTLEYTIMVDFRSQGFHLLQDELASGDIQLSSAANVGRALATLQLELSRPPLNSLEPIENPIVQIRERLFELHALLYGNLSLYREIETQLLRSDGLLYTDGHPKNIAVNAQGEVMVFDFGRIITGSRQFPAPNFAAHIALPMIAGVMSWDLGGEYIRACVAEYDKRVPLEEDVFVRFFIAELLHRGLAGRWVDRRLMGEFPDHTKRAVHDLALHVLDAVEPVTTMDGLLAALKGSVAAVKEGRYRSLHRP